MVNYKTKYSEKMFAIHTPSILHGEWMQIPFGTWGKGGTYILPLFLYFRENYAK
jgi:hypothetical protein